MKPSGGKKKTKKELGVLDLTASAKRQPKLHLVWSGPFLARTIDEDGGTEQLIC